MFLDPNPELFIDLYIYSSLGPYHESLRNVLETYVVYRPDVGYVCVCVYVLNLLQYCRRFFTESVMLSKIGRVSEYFNILLIYMLVSSLETMYPDKGFGANCIVISLHILFDTGARHVVHRVYAAIVYGRSRCIRMLCQYAEPKAIDVVF